MGYFGRFILGYGILPTPLTKPHYYVCNLEPKYIKLRNNVGVDMLFSCTLREDITCIYFPAKSGHPYIGLHVNTCKCSH